MKNLVILSILSFLSQAGFAQQSSATTTPAPEKKACCAAGSEKSGKACCAPGAAKTGAACSKEGTADANSSTSIALVNGQMTAREGTTASTQTVQFKVLGNCGMCKKTIEKAALGAGATTADWNVDTDKITVAFDEKKTSTDSIQKAIAKSGYDNAGYKASDKAYNNLHGCCQYDRTGAAGGTKSCSDSN